MSITLFRTPVAGLVVLPVPFGSFKIVEVYFRLY